MARTIFEDEVRLVRAGEKRLFRNLEVYVDELGFRGPCSTVTAEFCGGRVETNHTYIVLLVDPEADPGTPGEASDGPDDG